jgi:hypothetical protein
MQIGNIKHLMRTDISEKMAKRGERESKEGEEVEVNLRSWLKEEEEKGRKRTVVSSQMDEEQLGQHFKEKVKVPSLTFLLPFCLPRYYLLLSLFTFFLFHSSSSTFPLSLFLLSPFSFPESRHGVFKFESSLG